ncbi:MAG: branched-chain amino acid ABC transporter permease [Actinomycetota bacterium]|jgi:branched-chain amino acid transport system permease protein
MKITQILLRLRYSSLGRLVLALLGTVVAICVVLLVSAQSDTYIANAGAMTIAILGLSLLTGWSGQVSIGNSGFMAVGAFTTGIWANHHQSSPIIISLLLSILTGAIAGLLVGIPATRLKGPYLAGMTLAFVTAMVPFIQSLGKLTGGSGGLFFANLSSPSWFANLSGDPQNFIVANYRWAATVSVVITGVAYYFMSNLFASRAGRAMRLVRDNDVAAELMGVNLGRVRVGAFVISAAYAGLAGSLVALLSGVARADNFGLALSIEILSLLVLGGIGTLSGALMAGLLAAYASTLIAKLNALFGLNPYSNLGSNSQGIIFGLLLVVTMLTAPQGMAGLLKKISHLRARKEAE